MLINEYLFYFFIDESCAMLYFYFIMLIGTWKPTDEFDQTQRVLRLDHFDIPSAVLVKAFCVSHSLYSPLVILCVRMFGRQSSGGVRAARLFDI